MFWYPLLNEKTIMIDILKRIVRSVFLGIVRLALAYVFSKCYIGGHSTNIGSGKRVPISPGTIGMCFQNAILVVIPPI